MKYNLENKSTIVTGASSGIGYALTKKLLEKGAKVVGCARNIETLHELKKEYPNLEVFKCDVTKYSEIDSLIDFTVEKFGGIDLVVNNAGIGLLKSVKDITVEEMENIMQTNFNAVFYLTKKTLPYFEKQQSGYYVNVASIAGRTPSIYNSIYTASKHAVIGFSNCLRREVHSKGIHVLVVNPTFVDTEFFKKNPQYLKEFGHHTKLVGFIPREEMATVAVRAIENMKWEVTHPFLAHAYALLCQVAPRVAELFA